MKLFSLNSNPEIAQKIADHAGVPLGKISSRQFSDGEIQVNIEESVRGYDIYIIQSTSFPVNNHLMELLIMVGCLPTGQRKYCQCGHALLRLCSPRPQNSWS